MAKGNGNSVERFEIYKALDGWRWRLVALNNRIIADSGESFTRRSSAVRSAALMRSGTYNADIVIVDGKAAKQ